MKTNKNSQVSNEASEELKKSEIAQKEEEILEFWQRENIFEKTLEKESPKGEFVFYEGPPTANGKPGIHHLESRSFKDAIPRYKTMQGFHVRRKAGWDTHGLPVELEVEKKLGLKSKKEIEQYGIAAFNKACRESVLDYIDLWDTFTKRIGYWVKQEEAYYTFDPSYMESLWWVVGEIDKKGLLYKDYKVVPWCPRCGTALSSHELAQGYADVKDLSVTAKFELLDEPGTFVLAWTTTPWTLPGNVALAVGEDIEYVKVKKGEETYVLAKERMSAYEKDLADSEVVETFKGSELIGKSYKPLFPYFKDIAEKKGIENLDNAYKIYVADFVTTEDGTGVVHTAVMYGQEDFELGNQVGLPKMHLVDEEGHFIQGTGEFEGRFVKEEGLDVDIIKALAHSEPGLLFAKEKYEHSYPHCWRCKTPLIYYARDSWYIRVSEIRDELVKENEDINWEPGHIKDGRFGEWLKGIRDWAISRERYWGTPLPVWESEDGDRIVVDSIETLQKYTKKSGNTFFLVRHGEAESNLTKKIACMIDCNDPLTEQGRRQAEEVAKKFKDIDLIVTSPILRTRETAEIISEKLGGIEIEVDERLIELQLGKEYEGDPWFEYWHDHPIDEQMSDSGGSESRMDLKRRVGQMLLELDQKYQNKRILLVGHNASLSMLMAAASFASFEETKNFVKSQVFGPNVGVFEINDFKNLPHNDNFELDLHRPYIDEVVLEKDDKEYRRVKEVMDVWFDSGAMPFAQDHYPFENKGYIDSVGYPGDYISEAIDQTRGWFYTLHAVGNLLGKGKAYKNVICLGHLLDEKGQKMSKSKGNVINPWEAMANWGADTIRFWMYSVNGPGESKSFDPKTVDEVQRKVFNLIRNVVSFYEMYGSGDSSEVKYQYPESTSVLDQWILSLLSKLIADVTTSLNRYDLLTATRAIRDFVGDLSQWYVRRSRDRFKEEGEDKARAEQTTRYVLHTLARLMAPFAPFAAEEVFGSVRGEGDPESVHLAAWPEINSKEGTELILDQMEGLRAYVSLALEARDRAGIKVRQPLQSATIFKALWTQNPELVEIFKDEVNVKEILLSVEVKEVMLDVNITDNLRQEGIARDFMRSVQGMRKDAGMNPGDRVRVIVSAPEETQRAVEEFKEEIASTVGAQEIVFEDASKELSIRIEKA